jgi:formamidopyrimidine-DNA glycosylase
MPELPEVEVTRLSFANRIQGASIQRVTMGKPLRWQLGCDPKNLAGQTVRCVSRRGKYLILELSAGLLLIHLGMSGSLQFAAGLPMPGVHDHFSMDTNLGTLRLNDPRRFGAVIYASAPDDPIVQKLLGKLGAEPLSDEFDAGTFTRQLRAHKAAVKQVLLAGTVVVGVGNIYACEALFRAGIRPSTRCNRLGPQRCEHLHAAIRSVLARAVEQGGSTLRNFSNADGQAGHFQLEAQVYGREAQPCAVCETPIKRIVQGQRSTYFCPACQHH